MRVNFGERGFLVVRVLQWSIWCLFETCPFLFLTGRAELMFHFRKHPLPLDPQPDVWHHPGLFHAGSDVHCLTVPDPVSSIKLNPHRQWKARDTSPMPHLTRKVNYDVGLIITVKFQLIQVISYLRQKLDPLPVARTCYMENLPTKNCKENLCGNQTKQQGRCHITGFSLESEKYVPHVAKKKKNKLWGWSKSTAVIKPLP